jgi:3-oxoacyl-[acyl-carrier-protein] synthase II
MPRVVVTGMGAITPLGIGFKESWSNLLKNKTGIVKAEKLEGYDFKCRIGSPMPSQVFGEEFQRDNKMRMDDPFYSVANYIMKEAIETSGIDMGSGLHVPRDRVGIAISNLGEAL